MVPCRPLPCVNIISHPCLDHPRCVTLVSMEFVVSPLQSSYSDPYIILSHPSHFSYIASISTTQSSQNLIWVIDNPLCNWVSPYQVSHPYYTLTREVVSQPPILFSSIIIPGVSLSVTILWFLVTLLMIPYYLNSGRPSSVNLSTFIPEEFPRGPCTLPLAYMSIRCLRSSKGNHHFPLTWLFLMCSTLASYHTIEICTLDGLVIQMIVPVIPKCVWDFSNLIRGWPLR